MSRAKAVRQTRRERARAQADENLRRIQQYVAQEIEVVKPQKIPALEPKNQNQKTALSYLMSDTPVVFLTGSAGTGKSLLAAYRAATLLKSKQIDKVFLVRPAVAVGKSIGLLPGEIEEKLAPYFAQTVAHLEKFLGKGYLNYCLEKKVIEMKPAEFLRGMSFESCLVICEECQNFTHEEFEMMLTRLGDNAQMVFTGDTRQNDLRGASGLKTTVEMIERMLQTHPEYMAREDIDALDESVGVVRFLPDDVVRSGLTKAFVRMYFYS